MIGIGKDELIIWLILETHALEGGIGRDRHKPRRVNNTVRCMYPTHSRPRLGGLFDDLETEE